MRRATSIPCIGLLVVGILGGALSGCGFLWREPAPTPYQPFKDTRWHSIPDESGDIRGGYSERHLGGDHFEVRFQGNGASDPKTVARYARRRAAEVCEANGLNGYRIVEDGETKGDIYLEHVGVKMPYVTLHVVCVDQPNDHKA